MSLGYRILAMAKIIYEAGITKDETKLLIQENHFYFLVHMKALSPLFRMRYGSLLSSKK